MSLPFYVAPEQQMKDRADYARKGIARGRSVVVLLYVDGILFVAENRSQALHKVSEIYDRIAFAAVGRYNEFENLRQAGIRYADLRGYSYDRTDVTGRGLANTYAQVLGTIFSSGGDKPYEVEIVVTDSVPTSALPTRPSLRCARSVPTVAQMRPRARWAWKPWKSLSSTGPGQCRASSGVSRVIGLPLCLPTGPDPQARPTRRDRIKVRLTARRSPRTGPPARERDHITHRR